MMKFKRLMSVEIVMMAEVDYHDTVMWYESQNGTADYWDVKQRRNQLQDVKMEQADKIGWTDYWFLGQTSLIWAPLYKGVI